MTKNERNRLHAPTRLRATAAVFILVIVSGQGCASFRSDGYHDADTVAVTFGAGAVASDFPDSETPAAYAQTALERLNVANAGGPDYGAAARLFLHAAEIADPDHEHALKIASYRAAARAALRAGDRDTYSKAVDGWDHFTTEYDRTTPEFAVHQAIWERIHGDAGEVAVRVPPHVRGLIEDQEE